MGGVSGPSTLAMHDMGLGPLVFVLGIALVVALEVEIVRTSRTATVVIADPVHITLLALTE